MEAFLCIYSDYFVEKNLLLNYIMAFEKLEDLLPYPVHCVEEKVTMKPKEAIAWGEYEQELCDKAKQKKLKQTGME